MIIEPMSIENKPPGLNELHQPEDRESFPTTLDSFLAALQQEGVKTLPAEMIKENLDKTGVAIVTREYNCGIRISREGSKTRGYWYRTFTANALEDPNHPLSQKFARRDITIDD